MKTKKTYAEKLKDPRWQKKRLEIFAGAGWACKECGDGKSTLHAHHKTYKNRTDPWDYPMDNFLCLCESCHKKKHDKSLPMSLPKTIDGIDYPPESWFKENQADPFCVVNALHMDYRHGVYWLSIWHENPPACLGAISADYYDATQKANEAAAQIKSLCAYFFKGGRQ